MTLWAVGVRSSPQMRHAFEEDRSLADKYRPLQFDWCVEMYGYVFAAAELGIRHEIKHRLQVCCVCACCCERVVCMRGVNEACCVLRDS